MVYTIDILCPERNEAPVPETKADELREITFDRTKVTRLQVINIRGQIVDIDV